VTLYGSCVRRFFQMKYVKYQRLAYVHSTLWAEFMVGPYQEGIKVLLPNF